MGTPVSYTICFTLRVEGGMSSRNIALFLNYDYAACSAECLYIFYLVFIYIK